MLTVQIGHYSRKNPNRGEVGGGLRIWNIQGHQKIEHVEFPGVTIKNKVG